MGVGGGVAPVPPQFLGARAEHLMWTICLQSSQLKKGELLLTR